MELVERDFGSFTLVEITEGVASATLEMHQGYFTYYWRTRVDQLGFLELVLPRTRNRYDAEEIQTAGPTLTVVDEFGNRQERALENEGIIRDAFEIIAGSPKARWSLLRVEGPGESWVWQYAPDDKELKKHTKAPYKKRLAAYFGCAGSVERTNLFQTANRLMAASAIESSLLTRHLDLLKVYIDRWGRSNRS